MCTALRYINRNSTHAALTGFYRPASAGLVTPLRDGMSLIAEEHVAAQDPGVLVPSILAGTSYEMRESLIVSRHDLEGVADATAAARTMPRLQRIERWRSTMEHLEANNIGAWRGRCLESLEPC